MKWPQKRTAAIVGYCASHGCEASSGTAPVVDEPEGQACVVCGNSNNFTADSIRVLLGCDGCSNYKHAGYFPDADRDNDPGRRAPGRLEIYTMSLISPLSKGRSAAVHIPHPEGIGSSPHCG